MFIVGNQVAIWDGVLTMIKGEIHSVLLELMVTMRKDSDADTVVIRFMREEEFLT